MVFPSPIPYLRPRIRTLIISTPCQTPLYPFPVLKKDGRSRPSLLLKTCMPSLYHIRVVIHSIHDSFVEIRGGLSYRNRHPHHTTFVLIIVLHSSPFSYHLRHRFHTTFVLPEFSKHLSINQFQNFPNFPKFPPFPEFPLFHDFHCFPPFPAFHAFHAFHAIPRFPPLQLKLLIVASLQPFVLLFFCLNNFCPSISSV